MRSKYVSDYGLPAKEIIIDVIAASVRKGKVAFTYNDVARLVYNQGYQIKLETIKRVIRKLKEEGLLAECGVRGKAKLFCVTTEFISIATPR